LTILGFESILALGQYIRQGPLGLSLETTTNIFDPQKLYLNIQSTSVFRPVGTLYQPNVLSFVLAFVLPFSLVFIFLKNTVLKSLAYLAIITGLAISIITLSRWGTITFLFSLLMFFVFCFLFKLGKLPFKNLLRAGVVILIFILVVFTSKPDYFTRFSTLSPDERSLVSRLELVTQALHVFRETKLGTGGGTFPAFLVNYDFTPLQISQYFPDPVHNFALLVISESGVFVFLIFLVMILYLVVSIFDYNRKTQKVDFLFKIFSVAVLTSTLTYMFNGLWEIRSLDERLIVIFWMNIGIYFSIRRKAELSNQLA
jgi:hypothetical protein